MSLQEYETVYKNKFEGNVLLIDSIEKCNQYETEFEKRITIDKESELYETYNYMWFEGLRLKKECNFEPPYKCSNCNVIICGECSSKLQEHLTIYDLYRCTHCRNNDFKRKMSCSVFPQLLEKTMGEEEYKSYRMKKCLRGLGLIDDSEI
jgi:DNA-directed RNA polymerase subunit RPC12/RpoP